MLAASVIMQLFTVCAVVLLSGVGYVGASGPHNQGQVDAVVDLLDRLHPDMKSHFELALDGSGCEHADEFCFTLEDTSDGKVAIRGTTASEVASGVGYYLREYNNMTIGWKRGGGSNVFIPKTWAIVGAKVVRTRNVEWSYIMNVCTHSYSLVWYSWNDWSAFIDWMALSGVNLFLAMTGQEEIQYRVFQQFGLKDEDIRNWFNGPAFLTWSRGQNEYGNKIAGPLPRSWMQDQHQLQIDILTRTRSLGMSGQLPGFQGNVPIQLKNVTGDQNITKQGDTGWMNSVDPLYAKIADAWMKEIIGDFGTDHWYQLDGYFNGGTAPWDSEAPASDIDASLPECTWSPLAKDTYLAGCEENCKSFTTVEDAKAACVVDRGCGGITSGDTKTWQLRTSSSPAKSPINEESYYITNMNDCRQVVSDPAWIERGTAAYTGLNRTDPDAIWSFQGWAFVGWNSVVQADHLKGFIDATPAGKFNVIDMSVNGEGEWKKWNNASFWGANFVWTTLHDFGGTDGLKGELDHVNEIPFGALEKQNANVWGTGFTPEGIDQNPAYYEFVLESCWRDARVTNITEHIIKRSHRRYGLTEIVPAVSDAWALLVDSAYSQDLSVQDPTGIPHLPGSASQFEDDRKTPTPKLCVIHAAWGKMIEASSSVDPTLETFRYDLVNTGRELLAQLSTPVSQNFSDAYHAPKIDAARLKETGDIYLDLLADADMLVKTESAFLLGPWLEMARYFGANSTDCVATGNPAIINCPDFYEWNARVQLTTWNPAIKDGDKIPGGPIDYASKHWSGLISDYYRKRADLVMQQAMSDATAGKPIDQTTIDKILSDHAYAFQNDFATKYPTSPVGDAVVVSKALYAKYLPYYASC